MIKLSKKTMTDGERCELIVKMTPLFIGIKLISDKEAKALLQAKLETIWEDAQNKFFIHDITNVYCQIREYTNRNVFLTDFVADLI